MPGVRNDIMVERPCITCLASSEQLVTIELAEKSQVANMAKPRAEYSTVLESVGKM